MRNSGSTKKTMRAPRPGCVEVVADGSYQLTDLGLANILELSTLGSSLEEIADYLCVSETWLREQLDEEVGDVRAVAAHLEGIGEARKRLRINQQNLSMSSAPMAIWLGEQMLGQRRNAEITVNKKVQVLVGTLPNYEQSAEDWQKAFAPKESHKQIEAAVEEAQVIDDDK